MAEILSGLRELLPGYGSRGSLTDNTALLSDQAQRSALLEQFGSVVEPYDPSLGEKIYNFTYDALGGNTATGPQKQRVQRWAGYPQQVIDQFPIAAFTDYSKARQDYARGDALSGTANMAMAATSFIPGQQRQAVDEVIKRITDGSFGRTLKYPASNVQVPFRSPISPQTDVPQIPFRPDTPVTNPSALRNLTDTPASALNDLDAGGSSQILASGSKRGTGVAASSALSGNYTDRIVQEYPKSYKPIIIDNYVNQGVDPRTFTAGSGSKSSDPRVGQMSILGGTNINIGDPRMGQVKEIDLGDYEGYPFFTSMSDRAAAGDVILDINGVPINVSRRGGQNYMFDPESGEFVWASDKGVALKSKGKKLSDTSFFKTAQDLKKTYGKDPLIIPWTMAPTGIDFSTQIGETMLSYAKNAMSRADLKSLDKDVKNIIPEWKGIDSPDWTVSFRNTTGNQRKVVSDLLDKKYVDKGGITSGIARYANTDVDLRMARDGQVRNVGMVDTDRYPVTDNRIVHPTYNTGLYGEGVGRIGGDVQVFELLPTARQLMGISDPLNPARSALRALEMKPYSGIITESTLRAIEDRRR